jgi:coenzyme F420-dependent glucose-6-phosphate dehydrogenase
MVRIGYHASHEQFSPSELFGLVRAAETSGFDCAMSSDNFRPWASAQRPVRFCVVMAGRGHADHAPGYRYTLP